jgi:hypothetical protein
METKEEQIVVLPHFTSEEVEGLKVERERRELLFKGRGLLDNDDERVRDAHQREAYWQAQIDHLFELGLEQSPDMRHAEEELGHCLFIQGRIDEALALTESAERRTHYLSVHAAIQKDDEEACDCESKEHVVGKFPSFKHQGQMRDVRVCPECKTVNIG